jgi:hypothetical protein
MTDPTELTTEALQREIQQVKELVKAQLEAIQEVSVVRFVGIERDFAAIEAWRKEQKLDTKTAVDAALQAAEKAVREQTVASEKAITKSETSASEQSKQQYATFKASLDGLDATVKDVKERLVKMESARLQQSESLAQSRSEQRDIRTDRRSDTNMGLYIAFGALTFLLGVAGIIVAVMTH